MTHNDIYTKFMIEYDKANVTSSYPSLTKYEVATLLDRAYLMLIARKLTGNNTRRAPFEYDTKAVEDLRPLVRTEALKFAIAGVAQNEFLYRLPEKMLYYLEGLVRYSNAMYNDETVTPVDHRTANKFKATNSNMPWIKSPVSYLEDDFLHLLIDPYEHVGNVNPTDTTTSSSPYFVATYIMAPAKFVIGDGSEEEENPYPEDNNSEEDNNNNNGGNDNNNNNNNNNGEDNNGGDDNDQGGNDTPTTKWEIYDKEVPATINNIRDAAAFDVYAFYDTTKTTCNIEVQTGEKLIDIKKDTSVENDIYRYRITVKMTGIATIKIICSQDPSVYKTKKIEVVKNIQDIGGGGTVDPSTKPSTVKYVDLGLSVKWAKWNYGANSDIECGDLVGWGDPTGNEVSRDGTYGTDSISDVPTDISLEHMELDIVRMNWGADWHTPTVAQLLELVEGCTWEQSLNYKGSGINGWLVTGKGDYSSNSIFIPASGYRDGLDNNGNARILLPNAAFYWSSETTDSTNGYGKPLYVQLSRTIREPYFIDAWHGMHIRPVYEGQESTPNAPANNNNQFIRYVDLGLPSGTKWGDRNLGATSVNDRGQFYGWGDPTGTKISVDDTYGETTLTLRGVTFPSDISQTNKDLDAAYVALGGNWHIPTTELMLELTTHCTWTLHENYNGITGLFGYEVRGTGNYSNNSIFIPCNGYRDGTDNNGNPIYSSNINEPYYWSSEVSGDTNTYKWGMFVKLYYLKLNYEKAQTYLGMYIRPVYSEPTE